MLPDSAIEGRKDYVFVVNAQDVVERRNVTVGPRVEELRAITQGLSKDDRVIIRGLAAVRPGAHVNVQQAPGPQAAEATPSGSPTPSGSRS
jgi:hypothetical protein